MQNLVENTVFEANFEEIKPNLSIDYDVPHPIHGFYDYVVNLRVGNHKGRVGLKQIDTGLLETHSSLDQELRGAGYGIMMYSAAIRLAKGMGFRVCSSPKREMTASGKRLWKSRELGKTFIIRQNWERFYVV